MSIGYRSLTLAAALTACLTVAAGCSSDRKGGVEQAHFLPPGGSLPASVIPLPSVGSPNYPKGIYPPPDSPTRQTGVIKACPAASGLQAPGSLSAIDATAIIGRWGTVSFPDDLHNADRAIWNDVRANWVSRNLQAPSAVTPTPILYTGPLAGQKGEVGAPDPSSWVLTACGRSILKLSYLVQTGSVNAPARQTDWLFVQRKGHLLLYLTY